jgi:hypothetical protein
MPEANVLYSVTAVVVVGLVAWVAVVLKTAKEPWSRPPVPQPRTEDVPVEDDAKAEPAEDDAKAEPAEDDAKADDAKADDAKADDAKDEPAKDDAAEAKADDGAKAEKSST